MFPYSLLDPVGRTSLIGEYTPQTVRRRGKATVCSSSARVSSTLFFHTEEANKEGFILRALHTQYIYFVHEF